VRADAYAAAAAAAEAAVSDSAVGVAVWVRLLLPQLLAFWSCQQQEELPLLLLLGLARAASPSCCSRWMCHCRSVGSWGRGAAASGGVWWWGWWGRPAEDGAVYFLRNIDVLCPLVGDVECVLRIGCGLMGCKVLCILRFKVLLMDGGMHAINSRRKMLARCNWLLLDEMLKIKVLGSSSKLLGLVLLLLLLLLLQSPAIDHLSGLLKQLGGVAAARQGGGDVTKGDGECCLSDMYIVLPTSQQALHQRHVWVDSISMTTSLRHKGLWPELLSTESAAPAAAAAAHRRED